MGRRRRLKDSYGKFSSFASASHNSENFTCRLNRDTNVSIEALPTNYQQAAAYISQWAGVTKRAAILWVVEHHEQVERATETEYVDEDDWRGP